MTDHQVREAAPSAGDGRRRAHHPRDDAPSAAQNPAPLTPEEQLVQKYAPVTYIKRQDVPCDTGGEEYLPAPVEIAFGDPEVTLRRQPGRQEVRDAPGNADLFAPDADLYLDLIGHPEEPGCTYELRARERMGSQPPVTYAHIATEEGRHGLAVQYWFYWYFNDFNDKHESDWEMIQIIFDADTVEEALAEEPVSVAFAQHNGGETAPWAGDKLRKEDGHPVNYPSRGSHADYYGPAVWLGWGHDGSRSGLRQHDRPLGPADPRGPARPGDHRRPGRPLRLGDLRRSLGGPGSVDLRRAAGTERPSPVDGADQLGRKGCATPA